MILGQSISPLRYRTIWADGAPWSPITEWGANCKFLYDGYNEPFISNGTYVDVLGVTGQNDNLASTPAYASDFSVNADGWIDFGTRLDPTGNIDGIAGEDDCLRVEPYGGSTTQHYMYASSATSWVIGNSYRFRMKYYIPSANTLVNGVTAGGGVSTRDYQMNEFGTTDTWVQTEWYYMTLRVSTGLYIMSNIDGDAYHTSSAIRGDNYIYFKDIEVEDMTAPNLKQTTVANSPTHTDGVAGLVGNGSSDFFNLPWDDIKDDVTGFWWFKFKDAASGNVFPYYYYKTSGSRAVTGYIGTDSKWKIVISGQSTLVFNTISGGRSQTHTTISGSDATESYLYTDDAFQTLTSGTDIAAWMATVADDTGELGVIGNSTIPTYQNITIYSMGYVGGAAVAKPTAAQMALLTAWIDALVIIPPLS